MAGRLARLSFRNRTVRGRRVILLAALGASAALSFLSMGAASASASASRERVHRLLRDAPPLAHTGGFGEPTCLTCHMDGELNETGGTLVIEGLPARYAAGRRYVLTVAVSHPELRAAGFELSARYESGPDSARQAGALAVSDDRAKVSTEETTRVQYAHHLRSGTTPLPAGSGRWTIAWIAPATPSGPVVFHVAANAANDNDSPMGDYIYARSFTVRASEK
jgi:hypothetical protein